MSDERQASLERRTAEWTPAVRPGPIQRAAVHAEPVDDVSPLVGDGLRSPGQPLDSTTRVFMEHRFAHDFGQVRVHTDAGAAVSARAVDALAYTAGRDIVFGHGQYAPHTVAGQRLLAHELAHVVQQGSGPQPAATGTALSDPASEPEQEAAHAASEVLAGPEPAGRGPAAPRIHRAPAAAIQRQVANPGLSTLRMPAETIDLGPGEAISATNPKLVRLATSFKALAASSPQAYIDLSAYLSEASSMSSEKTAQERRQLGTRMQAARSVLASLGVPADKVRIEPATAFATRLGGQISATLYKEPRPLLLPAAPGLAPPVGGTKPAAKPAPSMPSLGDLLTFKFKGGPVEFTVDLPKSAKARLPVALSSARSLAFELEAESSGSFSFSVTLDAQPHLRVGLKAGVTVDKDKGTSGSAGLTIETLHTVCHADNPEALKAKIKSAGEKLKKAGQEYSAAKTNEDRLSKAVDLAGAVGEMYDAVDKSKKGCKQVPAAKFEFGVKGPLESTPGALAEPDPSKRPATYIGGTITIPF